MWQDQKSLLIAPVLIICLKCKLKPRPRSNKNYLWTSGVSLLNDNDRQQIGVDLAIALGQSPDRVLTGDYRSDGAIVGSFVQGSNVCDYEISPNKDISYSLNADDTEYLNEYFRAVNDSEGYRYDGEDQMLYFCGRRGILHMDKGVQCGRGWLSQGEKCHVGGGSSSASTPQKAKSANRPGASAGSGSNYRQLNVELAGKSPLWDGMTENEKIGASRHLGDLDAKGVKGSVFDKLKLAKTMHRLEQKKQGQQNKQFQKMPEDDQRGLTKQMTDVAKKYPNMKDSDRTKLAQTMHRLEQKRSAKSSPPAAKAP